MMVNIIIDHMLFILDDMVIVLKTFLGNFAKNGLESVQGKKLDFSINIFKMFVEV